MTAYSNGRPPTAKWCLPSIYSASLWEPLRSKLPSVHSMYVQGKWVGFAYSRQRQVILAFRKVV